MSWLSHHTESEGYVIQAELAASHEDAEAARIIYGRAAEKEERAISAVELGEQKRLGITVVSAVSLWFKAREYRQAEGLAYSWLISDTLPPFAIIQLRTLLQSIWERYPAWALIAPCGEGETSDDDCLFASDGEGYQVEIKVMPDDWHDPAWDKRESEPCYYSEKGASSEPSYYSGGAS